MEIKIDKFKLIAGGIGGMEVWRTEPVRKGNIISLDQVHRTRKLQIDKPLREKIQKLKYYYLAITRHWMTPFDKYFDHDELRPLPLPDGDTIPIGQDLLKKLWNDTAINGVSVKDDGFVIMGSIESAVEGKKMGISTPYITAEDDYLFYSEAYEYIIEIGNEINKYLYSNLLPLEEAKEQYMLEHNLNELSEEDKEKLTQMLIDKFHEKGAIVLVDSSEMVQSLEESTEPEAALHQSKGNIAPGRFQETDDGDGQMIIPENKGKVPNEFAAGSDETSPEQLADLEHSDNMLVEGDNWGDND